MSEEINNIFSASKAHMEHSIEHLRFELTKIRTGKASPAILDGLKVNYYGNPTQLSQVANLSTPDSKTISIQPWEKGMLAQIEQAIFAANIGLTPMNDGETIRITIPPLTEERRRDLVKVAKALGEDAKVSIRNERQKIMSTIKTEVKNGFAEDLGKNKEAEVQTIVNSYGDKIAKLIDAKEIDIMTV